MHRFICTYMHTYIYIYMPMRVHMCIYAYMHLSTCMCMWRCGHALGHRTGMGGHKSRAKWDVPTLISFYDGLPIRPQRWALNSWVSG